MKPALGIIATLLTFVAYIPYYRDILRGKTHPHIYSWSLWCLLTVLIVALQIKDGAGPGVFVTIAAGLMCIGVVLLSFKHGKKDITISDTVVLILTLVAIAFWLVADQPITSLILAIAADLLAFIPTIRKSWNKPYSETLSLFVTNTFRFILALLAVQNYTILTALWLFVWAIGNGLFSLLIILRRKQVPRPL